MTETPEKRLDEIRQRLAETHPRPWRVVGADAWRLEGFPQVEMNTPDGKYFPVNDDATAQFIAHAPDDIEYLLSEVSRLASLIDQTIP